MVQWASLIVLGALLIFIPIWNRLAPAGIRDEVYNEVTATSDPEKAAATANATAHGTDSGALLLPAAVSNGIDHKQAETELAPVSAAPAASPRVTIHFASNFLA